VTKTETSQLLRTPFYDIHTSLKAKMVTFSGWTMPLMYTGILSEHHLVREKAGLFDTSHMGEFEIEGEDALGLVQKLVTNDVSKLNVNQVLYTPMCQDNGGIIDDLLVYRLGERHFMLVVNASNIQKDYKWVLDNVQGLKVKVRDISYQTALLALQGPQSGKILQELVKGDLDSLKYYWFIKDEVYGIKGIISRTGYTGELGYEIFITDAKQEKLEGLWNALMEKGRDYGLGPCGLGARDTLRLEMKYALYGNDIDEATNPLEAKLGWTVKFNKGDFNGREALWRIRDNGVTRRLVGFVMFDKGIARHGYGIFMDEERIGYVTSGSFSPVLGKSIGMAYVEDDFAETGTEFDVEIRGRKCKAKVVDTPFIK